MLAPPRRRAAAPPREVSRSKKGARAREIAMPSTPSGSSSNGIANNVELNLNHLDDAEGHSR